MKYAALYNKPRRGYFDITATGTRLAAKRGRVHTIILQPETHPEFGGYCSASVPALPGCFSYGTTRQDVLQNIKGEIELHLEDLEAVGDPIPDEQIQKVEVAVRCLACVVRRRANWFELWRSKVSFSLAAGVATESAIVS